MGLLDSIFGSKVSMPTYQPVDIGQSQTSAINENLASLPAAQNLASQTNQMNQEQLMQMLQTAIPGYTNMQQTASKNIQDMLSGKIPADVQSQVLNQDASKAVGGGYGGSGMQASLTAKDLGLTSLNLTQQGLSSAENWMQTTKNLAVPQQMQVQSMFLTPDQVYNAQAQQAQLQYQSQAAQAQANAAPDPTLSGLFNMGSGLLGIGLGGMMTGGLQQNYLGQLQNMLGQNAYNQGAAPNLFSGGTGDISGTISNMLGL